MQVVSTFNPSQVWRGGVSPDFVLLDSKAIAFYNFVQKRKGFVYAMQHPDRVGLLKVGRTAKNPFIRAKTLSTAGILGSFELLWVAEFANAAWGEALIHKALQPYHEDKEFFRVTLTEVKDVFKRVLTKELDLLKDLNPTQLQSHSYEDWISSLEVSAVLY